MKIYGHIIEIDITRQELANTLKRVIIDDYFNGEFDDGACDWLTKDNNTYISGKDWLASNEEDVASLVDAMNILQHGCKLEANE